MRNQLVACIFASDLQKMATKAISGLYAGISENDQVNDFIWQLIHPMKPVAEYLRTFI